MYLEEKAILVCNATENQILKNKYREIFSLKCSTCYYLAYLTKQKPFCKNFLKYFGNSSLEAKFRLSSLSSYIDISDIENKSLSFQEGERNKNGIIELDHPFWL